MKVKIDITILYWFLGFNTAFHIFREAFPLLNYLYIATLVVLAARSVLIATISKKTNSIVLLRLIVLIISIGCSSIYSISWMKTTFIQCVSVILICLVCIKSPYESEWNSFVNGYKVSILIDFVYAIIQAAFHFVGVEINQYLFQLFDISRSAQLNEDIARYGINALTRVTGLIWDPYVLGMYCATGFFLFKNKYIRLVALMLLAFSQSRSGLVGAMAGLIYFYWPKIKRQNTFIAFIIISIIGAIVIPEMFDISRGFNPNSLGWRRVEYITLLPQVFMSKSPFLLTLFGGSPGFTGARFYFSKISSMVNLTTNYAEWSIESDWLGVLYGQGIVGLFSYILTFYYLLKNQVDRKYKSLILVILFGGMGYFYYTAIFANMLIYLPLSFTSVVQDETN